MCIMTVCIVGFPHWEIVLAEIARRRKGRLATPDSGLAALHNDVAVLLPL
jgi:hypothetical protein